MIEMLSSKIGADLHTHCQLAGCWIEAVGAADPVTDSHSGSC